MKTIIFTGPDCTQCLACKNYIKENNIDIQQIYIDISEREGRNLQIQYKVMGIPTILELEDGKEVKRIPGNEALDYLSKM